jgi:hypothetical protein
MGRGPAVARGRAHRSPPRRQASGTAASHQGLAIPCLSKSPVGAPPAAQGPAIPQAFVRKRRQGTERRASAHGRTGHPACVPRPMPVPASQKSRWMYPTLPAPLPRQCIAYAACPCRALELQPGRIAIGVVSCRLPPGPIHSGVPNKSPVGAPHHQSHRSQPFVRKRSLRSILHVSGIGIGSRTERAHGYQHLCSAACLPWRCTLEARTDRSHKAARGRPFWMTRTVVRTAPQPGSARRGRQTGVRPAPTQLCCCCIQ